MCDFFAAHTSRTCVVNDTVEAVTVVSSLMRAQYLGGDFVRCLAASVGTPHDADLPCDERVQVLGQNASDAYFEDMKEVLVAFDSVYMATPAGRMQGAGATQVRSGMS